MNVFYNLKVNFSKRRKYLCLIFLKENIDQVEKTINYRIVDFGRNRDNTNEVRIGQFFFCAEGIGMIFFIY